MWRSRIIKATHRILTFAALVTGLVCADSCRPRFSRSPRNSLASDCHSVGWRYRYELPDDARLGEKCTLTLGASGGFFFADIDAYVSHGRTFQEEEVRLVLLRYSRGGVCSECSPGSHPEMLETHYPVQTGVLIPLWALTLVFGFFPTICWIRRRRRERARRKRGLCPACGYNLAGNTSGACPECGTARLPSQETLHDHATEPTP